MDRRSFDGQGCGQQCGWVLSQWLVMGMAISFTLRTHGHLPGWWWHVEKWGGNDPRLNQKLRGKWSVREPQLWTLVKTSFGDFH